MMRDDAQPGALHEEDHRVEGVAKAGGRPGDGVEHGLELRHGAVDDAQDLARRALALERVRQLPVARHERLAQTLVLEGDRRLVGESAEQLDLLRREGADACPPDDDESDGAAVT
jgi:hypothetical protein